MNNEIPSAAFGRNQIKLSPTDGVAIPERIFASLRLCVSSFLQPINDSKDPILDQLRAEFDQQSQTKVCQPTESPKKRAHAKAQRRKDAKENQREKGYYLFDPVFCSLKINGPKIGECDSGGQICEDSFFCPRFFCLLAVQLSKELCPRMARRSHG